MSALKARWGLFTLDRAFTLRSLLRIRHPLRVTPEGALEGAFLNRRRVFPANFLLKRGLWRSFGLSSLNLDILTVNGTYSVKTILFLDRLGEILLLKFRVVIIKRLSALLSGRVIGRRYVLCDASKGRVGLNDALFSRRGVEVSRADNHGTFLIPVIFLALL